MFVKLWLPVTYTTVHLGIQSKRDVIRLIDSTKEHNDGLKELEAGRAFNRSSRKPM